MGPGAFPSLRTLARETSLAEKTVRAHLLTAHERGWIVRERRFDESGRQTSNFYRLTFPGEGTLPSKGRGEGESHGRGEGESKGTPRKAKKEKQRRNGSPENGELFDDEVATTGAPKANRDDFERLWALARGRGSKKKSWDEYRDAIRRAPAETIYRAREAYVAQAEEVRFVRYLETWLRDDGWNDVDFDAPVPEPEPGSDAWLEREKELMRRDLD